MWSFNSFLQFGTHQHQQSTSIGMSKANSWTPDDSYGAACTILRTLQSAYGINRRLISPRDYLSSIEAADKAFDLLLPTENKALTCGNSDINAMLAQTPGILSIDKTKFTVESSPRVSTELFGKVIEDERFPIIMDRDFFKLNAREEKKNVKNTVSKSKRQWCTMWIENAIILNTNFYSTTKNLVFFFSLLFIFLSLWLSTNVYHTNITIVPLYCIQQVFQHISSSSVNLYWGKCDASAQLFFLFLDGTSTSFHTIAKNVSHFSYVSAKWNREYEWYTIVCHELAHGEASTFSAYTRQSEANKEHSLFFCLLFALTQSTKKRKIHVFGQQIANYSVNSISIDLPCLFLSKFVLWIRTHWRNRQII